MIEVDDSQFPLIFVRYMGTYTDDEFREYLKRMDQLIAEPRGMYGLVLDATAAKMPSGRQARMQAFWMRDNDAAIRARTVGTAFVLPSPALRGVLKAILLMQSMPTPYRVTATVDEAVAWLRQSLAAETRAT